MDSHFHPLVTQLTTMANALLKDVERIFAQDIRDPQLNPPGFDGHEQFIARVNAIGHELMKRRDYCLAAELYQNCISDAQHFRENTGTRRHLGTLYANLAISCLCHGNIDEGIYYFQHATNEDFQTAGIDPAASLANVLLEDFTTHVSVLIAKILSTHRLGIAQTDIETLFTNLPRPYYFAMLGYSYSFAYNYQYLQNLGGTPWFFTYNQMMSAIRNITAVFEDVQRSYLPTALSPRDVPRTLNGILAARHSSASRVAAPWWVMFADNQRLCNEKIGDIGFVATIQAIDALPCADYNDNIAYATLITYFTRNHLGHRLTEANEINLPLAMNLVGSMIYALIHVR